MDIINIIKLTTENWNNINEGIQLYDNPLTPNELDKIMKVIKSIQTTIISTFKSINPQYYKLRNMSKSDFNYSGDSNILSMDFLGIILSSYNVDQIKGPCDELIKIISKADNYIQTKFKLTPDKKEFKSYGTQYLMKNGKAIFMIENEGDKCDDRYWRVKIYCSNAEEFDKDNKYYSKYIKLLNYKS